MKEFYHRLATPCVIKDQLLDMVKNNRGWELRYELKSIVPRDLDLFRTDPVINRLLEEFDPKPVILTMEPNSFYNWHDDPNRTCSINMLITGDDSICMFGTSRPGGYFKINELSYTPGHFYILNTKEQHAVYNRTGPRAVLSLGFKLPHAYNDLVNFCVQNDL
jgi:hypothetical protein